VTSVTAAKSVLVYVEGIVANSMVTATSEKSEAKPAGTGKKRLVRRGPDSSQRLRRAVQILFLALNVWIGIEFYLFVRHYETAGQSVAVSRPPGVEGWLPIASLMNLKVLLLTGSVPRIHPAGMFLLIAFVAISWLLRKSFCSWLCPVGTLSEWLGRLGERTFGKHYRLPRWFDISLRSLKYILLALFLYAVGSMSTAAILAFLEGPYGIVADVKMLNFFRELSLAGGIILAALVLLSVFIRDFWCRYLCPYGALFGLASLLSPLRILRNQETCIDCAKCAKACPAQLPVDRLITIRSADCTGCYECVAICPSEGALAMSLGKRRQISPWAVAAGIAILFFGLVGYARWSGRWATDVSNDTYRTLVPRANEFQHP